MSISSFSKKIRIDHDKLEQERDFMDRALNDFSNETENILNNILKMIEDMNSTYTKEYQLLVEDLKLKNEETLVMRSNENIYGIGLINDLMYDVDNSFHQRIGIDIPQKAEEDL